ncbi:MAG: hypothetical protein NC337_04280, partial [Roseburia sp.]|nr:hypothetical protein [Roseburia sp.]
LAAAWIASATPTYVSETEYYIDFAEGRLEAKDYYNAFTWNDVVRNDEILGRMMETLGDGYVREQVGDMITADILSDVRYLIITVKGPDAADVERVQAALQAALETFADTKDEFDSISKVEDLGVVQERVRLFSARAALLGAVLFVCVGAFVTALRFGLGDCIYTKADISRYFGIPAYGMRYAEGKNARQEEMLLAGIGRLLTEREELVLADGGRDGAAAALAREPEALAAPGVKGRIRALEADSDMRAAAVLMVIPFGVPCRRKTADEINYLRLQGHEIVGAVLVDVDRRWMDIYMNETVHWRGAGK